MKTTLCLSFIISIYSLDTSTHHEQEQQQHQQKQQGPVAAAVWPVAMLMSRTIPIMRVRISLLPQLTSSGPPAAAGGAEAQLPQLSQLTSAGRLSGPGCW